MCVCVRDTLYTLYMYIDLHMHMYVHMHTAIHVVKATTSPPSPPSPPSPEPRRFPPASRHDPERPLQGTPRAPTSSARSRNGQRSARHQQDVDRPYPRQPFPSNGLQANGRPTGASRVEEGLVWRDPCVLWEEDASLYPGAEARPADIQTEGQPRAGSEGQPGIYGMAAAHVNTGTCMYMYDPSMCDFYAHYTCICFDTKNCDVPIHIT